MKRVLITGVSGYIGGKLASALEKNDQVECLAGLDVREPKTPFKRLLFLKQDIRQPFDHILEEHQIDTVVHTAWVVEQMRNTAEAEDINKSGTLNVLYCCVKTNVSRILYTSSTTAYGFHPDNPIPLTEESPLRGNEDFTYGKNKREIEDVFEEFIREHPEINVTVLRPCFVVGPGFDNGMSRYLTQGKIPLPSQTAPMQFVHEDDLLRAILHCLEKSVKGVFNIAGHGTMTFEEMADVQGHKTVNLPDFLLNGLTTLLYALRLKDTKKSSLNMARYPWIASPEKFIKQTGFEYVYNTKSAFEDFVKHIQSQ